MTMATQRSVNRRMSKALVLVQSAPGWIKCRDRQTSRPLYYGVPASKDPNAHHLANTTSCTCPDFVQRQGPRGDVCCHILAVRFWIGEVKAAKAATFTPQVEQDIAELFPTAENIGVREVAA